MKYCEIVPISGYAARLVRTRCCQLLLRDAWRTNPQMQLVSWIAIKCKWCARWECMMELVCDGGTKRGNKPKQQPVLRKGQTFKSLNKFDTRSVKNDKSCSERLYVSRIVRVAFCNRTEYDSRRAANLGQSTKMWWGSSKRWHPNLHQG